MSGDGSALKSFGGFGTGDLPAQPWHPRVVAHAMVEPEIRLVKLTARLDWSVLAAIEQVARAQDSLHPNLDDHPSWIGSRCPVALGVTQLGVADGVGVTADGGLALQGQPAGTVDLAQYGYATLGGIDRLL